jgi:hypothetical protein
LIDALQLRVGVAGLKRQDLSGRPVGGGVSNEH